MNRKNKIRKNSAVMDKQKQISLLHDLIQIPTIDDHEKQVVNYLAKLFAPYGDLVRFTRVPYQGDRESVVISIGPTDGKFKLGFSGHMDVVNLGDKAAWNDDPFSGKLYDHDSKMFGRGTTDMKSGLAGMIGVFLTLLDEQVELKGELRLLASVGEETGQWGAEELTKEGYVNDLDVLVIGEDSNLNISYAGNGDIDYTVTSYGKVVRTDQVGVLNAVDNLMDFIQLANQKLRHLPRVHETLGPVLHNVTMLSGGDQVNSMPGKVAARANIRINPLYKVSEIQAVLQDVLDEVNQLPKHKLTIHYDYQGEAVMGDSTNEYITTAQNLLSKIADKPIKLITETGTTDASKFVQSPNAPTIFVIGPGNESGHLINEYVDIPQYLVACEFYEQFAKHYLC
ncbi:ArgE/DapE family deacylase [Lactobacillus sp. ESL0791]|uniref:ArgE/DapE family deacylase n=1 Tax=Lactobacillus sp. ESL0791 TaxID=2983234 RepID=UPI0023F6B9A2|nr:ArgE/DapE family deacylase [Lactobacillus sp. ESL0791]MDF7639007.1 ArgE/DapE family deacylase [Lactobacillus sp. ESL0791]